jgi:hypothetical protein
MAATSISGGNQGAVTQWTIPWTSDGSGNYTETLTGIIGVILRVVFDPGSTAPTDNYDVTLTDAHGLELLGTVGADRDTANSEGNTPANTAGFPIAVAPPLYLSISNAGSAKTGTIYIYTR